MVEHLEFVSNYNDLSTDQGFQFEFHCNRCGSGYRTTFRPSVAGKLTNALEGASSLLGGIFSTAANVGERVRSANWQQTHDNAFADAVSEIKPYFIQCPRCNSWVCRQKCWNTKKGLCKECAPDLGVEMAAAQASKSVEEVWAHAAMAEEDKKLGEAEWRQGITATCPKCEAPLSTNAKFCPSCGAPLKVSDKCPKCNAKLLPNAKFCAECGEKIA